MQEIVLPNKRKLIVYSSIKDLPIKRYAAYQKFNLIDAGLGADMESIAKHMAKLFQYLNNELPKEALIEAKNLYYTFHLIFENEHPSALTFACIVFSINGELQEDFSDDGLQKIVDKLHSLGFTQEELEFNLEFLKKKLSDEINLYFKDVFQEDESLQLFSNIKTKIRTLAKAIQEDNLEDYESVLKKLEKDIAAFDKPGIFDQDNPENTVLKMELYFENLCSLLENNGIQNTKFLSTFEFYSRLSYLKKATSQLNQR